MYVHMMLPQRQKNLILRSIQHRMCWCQSSSFKWSWLQKDTAGVRTYPGPHIKLQQAAKCHAKHKGQHLGMPSCQPIMPEGLLNDVLKANQERNECCHVCRTLRVLVDPFFLPYHAFFSLIPAHTSYSCDSNEQIGGRCYINPPPRSGEKNPMFRRNVPASRFFSKRGSRCPGSQSQGANTPSFWLFGSWSNVETQSIPQFAKKNFHLSVSIWFLVSILSEPATGPVDMQ